MLSASKREAAEGVLLKTNSIEAIDVSLTVLKIDKTIIDFVFFIHSLPYCSACTAPPPPALSLKEKNQLFN